MKYIKEVIRSVMSKSAIDYIRIKFNLYANESFSQEGEDIVLRRYFESQHSGFYIDVGAHHPMRFSNTYLFYRQGWRGINIDAMPGSMTTFHKVRPKDINLEIPVGINESEIDYYIFNEPALNGFDAALAQRRHEANTKYVITNVIKLKVKPLSEILSESLPPGVVIDFLSVDVEGYDCQVLKSNDWQKFRPKIVLVEILGSNLQSIAQNDISKYMIENGYRIYAKTVNTVFFEDKLNCGKL